MYTKDCQQWCIAVCGGNGFLWGHSLFWKIHGCVRTFVVKHLPRTRWSSYRLRSCSGSWGLKWPIFHHLFVTSHFSRVAISSAWNREVSGGCVCDSDTLWDACLFFVLGARVCPSPVTTEPRCTMKVQAAALVLALSLWSIAAVQALDPPSSSLSSSSLSSSWSSLQAPVPKRPVLKRTNSKLLQLMQ